MNRWPDWPHYGLETDILPAAEACVARGERFALATLVATTGPSPRAIGSEMLVSESGAVHGYVSGGCVEAAVAHEALASLADGHARLLDYGEGSDFIDIRLTCGGRISVLVRPVHDPTWWISQLRAARLTRQVLSMVVDLATGAMHVYPEPAATSRGTFAQHYEPELRIVLVGSDPVTLATAKMAELVGLSVVLWRPDGPPDPPAGVALHAYRFRSSPQGLDDLPLDSYTAVYCLTHDMSLDVPVLGRALASEAFCVGVLGSRNKQDARRRALLADGVRPAQIDRLRTPAGLQIGAATPQQIALSILAEVVSCRPRLAPAVVTPSPSRRASAIA